MSLSDIVNTVMCNRYCVRLWDAGRRYAKWVKAFLPWLAVIVLGSPVFLLREGDVGSDAFNYLAVAWRIYRGMGYIVSPESPFYILTAFRSPMFSVLISLVFGLTGPSVSNALLVTRAAAFFSIVLLYLLGEKLYGREVGLVSVILVVTSSYMIGFPSHLVVDQTQTLFMLLSLFVFIQAVERGLYGLSIVAGVSLGIGFLCKELAVLWIPLPLLLILGIAKWRTWKNLFLVVTFWFGFALPVGSWWLHYYIVTGEVFLTASVFGGGYKLLIPLVIGTIAMFIAAGVGYLTYFRPTVGFAPLGAVLYRKILSHSSLLLSGIGWLTWLVFSVIFAVTLARLNAWIYSPLEIPTRFLSFLDHWRRLGVVPDQPLLRYTVVALVPVLIGAFLMRRDSDRVLIWSLLTYVPVTLAIATPDRYAPHRYLMTVFWLVYLALGRLLALVIGCAAAVLKWLRGRDDRLVHSLRSALLFILVVFGIWKGQAIPQTYEYTSNASTNVYNNEAVVETSRWLVEHVPPGSSIVSSFHYLPALYFYTGSQYEFHAIYNAGRALRIEQIWPYDMSAFLVNQRDRTVFVNKHRPDTMTFDPLQVRYSRTVTIQQGDYDPEFSSKTYFNVLSQRRLIDYLRHYSVDYLILTVGSHRYMMGALPDYFLDHPAFDQVFTATWRRGLDTFTLYVLEVDRARLTYVDYPVVLDAYTLETLLTEARQLAPGDMGYERHLLQALNYRPVLLRPRSPTDRDDYARMARIYAQYGEVDMAALQYHIALSKAPDQADLFHSVAEQLAAEYPEFVGSWLLLGDVYRFQNRMDLAGNAYKLALSVPIGTDETRAAVHRGLGEVYLATGRSQQAIQEFEQSMQLSDFGTAKARQQLLIAQGNLYRANGEIDQSVLAYQQAIAISPDGLVEAYLITKANMAEESKAYEETLAAYRQAFALALDNPKVRDALLEAYLAWGEQYFDQELLSEVIAAYEKDIELDPENVPAYWKLAEVYKTLGQMGEATAVYARILERWPESFDAHLYLAQAYETVGQMDRAITVYTRAVERWPDRAEAHFYLGQAYEAQGETEAASAAYRTAIESEPRSAGAYIRLGNIYKAQDSAEEATALYRAAAKRNRDAAWPHIELGKIYLEQANLR